MSVALSMTRAKTAVFFLTVTQSDGVTPQNLTGSVLWFHAAESLVGFAMDKYSPSNGITITNSVGGLATLQIEPTDTTALPNDGVFNMPCELTLQNGAEAYELTSGTITVAANVGAP